MRLYAPEKMVGTNPQYWIMQAQHISEGNFIPQTSGEENQDTPSSPILRPRRETRDQRNRPPHMRTRPNTAQGTGEIRRVPNSFQGFTFPGENYQGRSERHIYIPPYLRPQPAQSVNEESSSISATAPPQPQNRVLYDPTNKYHKAIAGRTQSTPIEVKDSQNTPENHTNRAMSSSKRPASRVEERDEDTSTPKRQRQSWNSMEQQYDTGFFENQDFGAANAEATIQNHASNFAPVFDTSQMNPMPREMHYRKNPHLRPHDANGNVLDVRDAPPVPQQPIQGQQARDQERVFDDRGGDGVDVRAGVEMQDDAAELARLQAQMQKVLDREKQKELPAQQQPQQTPYRSEASKKPSPPRLLSDEELRRQQALQQHFQAKSNQRIEHGHCPQLRSRSPPAQTSPPSSAMHSQRPLPDVRNSPHLLWNVESMSSQADLQHQPSQYSLQYPHQQPLSRAPSVRATDRPGNPVARELSSGRPTTEYGDRRVMSSESGMSGQGGRYRSDNWEVYSKDGEDANDSRGGAPGRAGMNGGGRQYREEMKASSNVYELPSRFDDGQGFYAPLRTQQDGLNDRYMQQRPQAQPRMHHFGQDQRSPSDYHEFDDNPHGNEGPAHARDMRDDQYQRPAPVHLRNENRNESQRLHSFGSHERMRREQQFNHRQFSDDSMHRQPQHEYRARGEQRMRPRQNTAERNDTSGRETHDAPRSMRAHHGITDSRFDETRRNPPPLPFSDDFHIPREPQTKKRAIMNDSAGIPPHHRLPASPPPASNSMPAPKQPPKKAAPKPKQSKGRGGGGSNASCRSSNQAPRRQPGDDDDDDDDRLLPSRGTAQTSSGRHEGLNREGGKSKEQNGGGGQRNTSDSSNTSSGRSKNSHPSDSSKSRTTVEPSSARHAQTHILSRRNSMTTRRMPFPFRTPTPVQFPTQQTRAQNVRQPPLAGLDDFDEPYDGEQDGNYYQRIHSQPRNLSGNKPLRTQREPSREHSYAVPPAFSTNPLIQHAQIPNSPFPPKKSPYAPPPQPNELQRAARDFESTNFENAYVTPRDGGYNIGGGHGIGGACNIKAAYGNINAQHSHGIGGHNIGAGLDNIGESESIGGVLDGVYGNIGASRRDGNGFNSGATSQNIGGHSRIGAPKPQRKKRTSLHSDYSLDYSSSDFSDEEELERCRNGKFNQNAEVGKRVEVGKAKGNDLQNRLVQDRALIVHLMSLAIPQAQLAETAEEQNDEVTNQATRPDVRRETDDVEMGGMHSPASPSTQPEPASLSNPPYAQLTNAPQPALSPVDQPRPDSITLPSKLDNIPNLQPSKAVGLEGRRPINFNVGRKPRRPALSTLDRIFGALENDDLSAEPQPAPDATDATESFTPAPAAEAPQDTARAASQAEPIPQPATQTGPNPPTRSQIIEAAAKKRAKAEAIRAKLAEKGVISTAAKARALSEGSAADEGNAGYKLKSPKEIEEEEAAAQARDGGVAGIGKGKDKEVEPPAQDRTTEAQPLEKGNEAPAENDVNTDALFEDLTSPSLPIPSSTPSAAHPAEPLPSSQFPPSTAQSSHDHTSQQSFSPNPQDLGVPVFDPSRYDLAERNANSQEERVAIRDLKSRKLAEHRLKSEKLLSKNAEKDVGKGAKEANGVRDLAVLGEVEEERGLNEHIPKPATPSTSKVVEKSTNTPKLKKKSAGPATKKTPKSAVRERKAREEAVRASGEFKESQDVEIRDACGDDEDEEVMRGRGDAAPAQPAKVNREGGAPKPMPSVAKGKGKGPAAPLRQDQSDPANAVRGLTEVELIQLHRTAGNVERLLELQEAPGHPKQDSAHQAAPVRLVPDLVCELRDVKTELARVSAYTSDGDRIRLPSERRSKAGRPPLSTYVENAEVLTARELRERDLKNNRDFLIAEKAYLKRVSDKAAKPGAISKSEGAVRKEQEAHREKWWKTRKERDSETDRRAEENERKALGFPKDGGVLRGKGAAGGIMGRLRDSNKEAGMGMIDRTAGMPNALDDLSGTEDVESEEYGDFVQRPKTGQKSVPGGGHRGQGMHAEMAHAESRPVFSGKAYVVTAKTTKYTWIHVPVIAASQSAPAEATEQDANVNFEAEMEAEFEKAGENSNPASDVEPGEIVENADASTQGVPETTEKEDLFGDLAHPEKPQDSAPAPPESAADIPLAMPSVPIMESQVAQPPMRVIESIEHLIVSISFTSSSAKKAAGDHVLKCVSSQNQTPEDKAEDEAMVQQGVVQCNEQGELFKADVPGEDWELRVEVLEIPVGGN